jgi:hypothetical protein
VSFQIKRLGIGLLLAGAGVSGWLAWTRRDLAVAPAQRKAAAPFVRLAGAGVREGDQVLREKAELLDPTPLFFPTEWNYGQRPLREKNLRQPGQVFASFAPKLTVDEQTVVPYKGEEATVPEKLSDVLVQGNEAPFAGMGQVNVQKSTLPVRAGYLEVRQLRTGDVVISQPLTGILPPRTDFAPMEFLVLVGTAGLIGDPVLSSGSGWDEVDNFFRSYLVKAYRLGGRLPPGRYRVVVGA